MTQGPTPLHRAPLLEGARVRLRPICAQDFDSFYALSTDPVVYAGISGKPATREECWAKMLKMAGGWELLGYGSWVVEDKSSKQFLGAAGLMDAMRELSPPQNIAPESGWSFMPYAHGKGLAGESMKLALSWFDTAFPMRDTYAMINRDNHASHKLAERLGYEEQSAAQYNGHDLTIWHRPSPS